MIEKETDENLEIAEKSNFRAKPVIGRFGLMLVITSILIAIAAETKIFGDLKTEYKRDLAQAQASASWHSTTGRVKSSTVKKVWTTMQTRSSHFNFQPDVTYEYVANGKTYSQNRISFPNPQFNLENDAQKFARQYNPGDTVEVFFDTQNAQNSCLNKGITDALKSMFYWRADEKHNSE